MHFRTALSIWLSACAYAFAYAQNPAPNVRAVTGQMWDYTEGYNPVSTAVPFLQVSPDAESSALGDQGVATSPGLYSQHYNAAKYPFTSNDWGIGVSYSPWLAGLVPDMNMASLTGMYKATYRDVIAASFTYFSLGKVKFADRTGKVTDVFNPSEFSFDVSYSRLLADVFAVSVTGRFIYSNLTMGRNIAGVDTRAGFAGAVDIGFYYRQSFDFAHFQRGIVTAGLSFTNIGNKINYTQDYTQGSSRQFLPAMMRIGAGFGYEIDDYNTVSAYLEAAKLLVPTPPLYNAQDSVIIGKENNVNVFKGLFQSFNDAPGGSKEEFREVIWSAGLEYMWQQLLFIRAGYFFESKYKGGRQYVSLGVGVQYKMVGIDFAYLIPTTGTVGSNPLKNTLRVGVKFNFNCPTRRIKPTPGSSPVDEQEYDEYYTQNR